MAKDKYECAANYYAVVIRLVNWMPSGKGTRNMKLRKYRQHLTSFVALTLLALSLRHLSAGVTLVTGSPALESLAMAIGIDCAMVAAEVAILYGTSTKWAHALVMATLILSGGFNVLAFDAHAISDLGHVLAVALGIFIPGSIYALIQVLGSTQKRKTKARVKVTGRKPILKAVA